MELNHKILGEGDPIIILHGLFGMLDNWQSVAKALSEDFMVILVDLRNHGKSPHSTNWNIPLMADDVISFMNDNWIYEANIIGHSMGGKVAMEIALKEPDLIQNLVVVDIAPKAYEPGHDLIFDALQNVPVDKLESRGDAEQYLAEKIDEWGIRQFLMKNLARNKDGTYSWKMNLQVIAENYNEILKVIDSGRTFENPTLFIRGANSNYILDKDVEYINELFTDAEIKTVEDSGHWVHADQREVLVKMIRSFLTNVNNG